MPIIDGVKGLLSYVACNPREFFFKNARRQAEFLAIFGQQRSDFIKETLSKQRSQMVTPAYRPHRSLRKHFLNRPRQIHHPHLQKLLWR